ncbi:S1C family serine protease [Mariniblastus fucicola]|nr:S1C family serine protease [Mariniblastus fucicola]
MSKLNDLRTTFYLRAASLICLVALFVSVPVGFAQTLEVQGDILLEVETILGESEEGSEELSRLVDKSTIADLEFLNSGESPTSIDQLKAMQDHVASLYQRVEPAVVNIQSGMGQGSGVVVTSDGYILTAAHVISIPNRSAIITFPDGSRARAQTLGLFRGLDAGLLKIYAMVPEASDPSKDEGKEEAEVEDADSNDGDEEETPEADESDDSKMDSDKNSSDEDSSDEDSSDTDVPDEQEEPESDSGDSESDDEEDKSDAEGDSEEDTGPEKVDRFAVADDLPSFSYLEIGDSAELKLGQWVIAVGHPGGIDEDRGIVLRVGRINEIKREEDSVYVSTDCTLVGGDSGGPLIGMDGSVVGIHSRIGMQLRQNFHVPSNDFVDNWTALINPVVHDRDPEVNLNFRGRTNVIASVPRRSLAARSGLRSSDRVIRVGDKEIYDKLQFDDAISDLKPYQQVEFEVQRKGKKTVVDVTIGEKSEKVGFR